MFGVEYEAVDFRSNRGLSTIVRDFLGGTDKQLPRCRPDFVALPDRSIGVYGAAAYEDEGEVSGLRKVLVVELKKGGFSLTQKEVDQARDRFKAGVANNIEVIQAQDALARANDNQIAALYRFNQARADYARSIGQMEKVYAK